MRDAMGSVRTVSGHRLTMPPQEYTMKRFLKFALAATLALSAVGCKKPSLDASVTDLDNRIAASAEGDFNAAVAEGDAHWENRASEEETRLAIAAWERALTYETEGDRREALFPVVTKITAAQYWLSHGHLFFITRRSDREAQQQAAYQKCMEYGRLALAINNDGWNEAMTSGANINDAVKTLTVEDVAPAYWYSTCAGKWATIEGIAALLGYKDQIFAILTRLTELNDDFYYRALDRYFGVYYTKVPFMSPDLPQSRRLFERAINAYPGYLETRVLFVEEHLTKTGEGDLARAQLEYVINADAAALPEIEPENIRAQRHARNLLARYDEFFR